MKKDTQAYLTITVFFFLIFTISLATLFSPSLLFSETENRLLAQKPKAEIEQILSGEFETAYEQYLSDQFIFRNQWIGLKTSIERLLLKTESKDIYFASDGYLIEKHAGIYMTERATRNVEILSSFIKKYMDQCNISVLIIPNAVDILDDKLPPFASNQEGSTYLKQIGALIPEGLWLDTFQILSNHKDEALYYHSDHHWKTLAAFYTYQAWAAKMGYSVPAYGDYQIETVTDCFTGTLQSKLGIATKMDSIELFLKKHSVDYLVQRGDTIEKSVYHYEALATKDKYAVFFGGNDALIKITTQAKSDRKILVIKDSYANCFIPFMLEEFQEIDLLDLRYSNMKLSDLLNESDYTNIMIMYNAVGFAEDMNITKLMN